MDTAKCEGEATFCLAKLTKRKVNEMKSLFTCMAIVLAVAGNAGAFEYGGECDGAEATVLAFEGTLNGRTACHSEEGPIAARVHEPIQVVLCGGTHGVGFVTVFEETVFLFMDSPDYDNNRAIFALTNHNGPTTELTLSGDIRGRGRLLRGLFTLHEDGCVVTGHVRARAVVLENLPEETE